MKSFFLDTNVLARFVIGDVPSQQKEAQDVFNKAAELNQDHFIIPEVLVELNYVLTRHYDLERFDIFETFKAILDLGFIKIFGNHNLNFEKVLEFYKKYSELSLEDCMYLQTCLQNNLELITFDKKLEDAYLKIKS